MPGVCFCAGQLVASSCSLSCPTMRTGHVAMSLIDFVPRWYETVKIVADTENLFFQCQNPHCVHDSGMAINM
jgi:hypothetical protein